MYFGLLSISLIPVWIPNFLPIQDYYNHLARVFIINNIDSNHHLSAFYSIDFKLIPNLAVDIVLSLINKIFNIYISGKIFLSILIILISSGTLRMYYEIHRKLDLYPLVSFIFMFNLSFMMGFMSYLFGIGIMLWVIALWIKTEKDRLWKRLLFASVSTIMLYFSHLSALGIIFVFIFAYELTKYIQSEDKKIRQPVVLASAMILFAIILFLLGPTSDSSGIIEFNKIYDKFYIGPRHLFGNSVGLYDNIILLILVILLIYAFIKQKIVVDKRLKFALVLLLLSYFIMPSSLLSAKNADWRIFFPLTLIFLSSSNIRSNRKSMYNYLFAFFGLIFILNTIFVTINFTGQQKRIQSIVNGIKTIDKGSKLYSAITYENHSNESVSLMHIQSIAVIERSSFVPTLFSFKTQQPLSYNENFINLKNSTMKTLFKAPGLINWKQITDSYDYVLLINANRFDSIPGGILQIIHNDKNANVMLFKNIDKTKN